MVLAETRTVNVSEKIHRYQTTPIESSNNMCRALKPGRCMRLRGVYQSRISSRQDKRHIRIYSNNLIFLIISTQLLPRIAPV